MLTEKLTRYGTFGTHDALKLIALISMFADHLGAFVYPDALWLRVLGRLAAPIFFFLIGYSRSYRIHIDLVLGAAILVGLKFANTHSLADLNILVAFILARLFFMLADKKPWLLKYPSIAFIILALPWMGSLYYIQFGTLGFLFALCGYVQKNAGRYNRYVRMAMLVSAFLIYGLAHVIMMHLWKPGTLCLALLFIGCGVMLWRYRPRALDLPSAMRPFAPAIEWPARYSLWIYVAHLAALQLITGQYV